MAYEDLKGKVAVITGGYGVLCSYMAKALAKEGVIVGILGRKKEKAKELADSIIADGQEAFYLIADVLNKESLIKAKNELENNYGKIDVLINGAGGNKKEATTSNDLSFFDLQQDDFKWVMDLNFIGTFLPTQVFAQLMVKEGKGSIINISSIASIRPLTKAGAYAAGKAAVNNFTTWLAVHFNQNYSKQIRVNAIAPGFFLAEQNQYLLIDKETGKDTLRGKKIKEHTSMDRYGDPKELTSSVLWLSSDDSSFVNGSIVTVDGGFSAYAGV